MVGLILEGRAFDFSASHFSALSGAVAVCFFRGTNMMTAAVR
jgi:hypothetical protein